MSMFDGEGNPPLEGEIVGPVPLIAGERHDRRSERRYHDEDTIAAVVRARALGATLREVADHFNISHESVRRWTGEAERSRNYTSAQAADVRARIALGLEALEHEAQRVVIANPGTKLALEAIKTAAGVKMARANLLGVVAPTRVHVDVAEADTTDHELKGLIEQHRAQAAAQIAEMNRNARRAQDGQ